MVTFYHGNPYCVDILDQGNCIIMVPLGSVDPDTLRLSCPLYLLEF